MLPAALLPPKQNNAFDTTSLINALQEVNQQKQLDNMLCQLKEVYGKKDAMKCDYCNKGGHEEESCRTKKRHVKQLKSGGMRSLAVLLDEEEDDYDRRRFRGNNRGNNRRFYRNNNGRRWYNNGNNGRNNGRYYNNNDNGNNNNNNGNNRNHNGNNNNNNNRDGRTVPINVIVSGDGNSRVTQPQIMPAQSTSHPQQLTYQLVDQN
jgi:hypothetical protein